MTVIEIRPDDLDAAIMTLMFNDMMHERDGLQFERNMIIEEDGILIKYLIWN